MLPVAALRRSSRGYVNLPNIIEAFVDGAKNALGVAAACACAGIVIAVVTLSGLGITFTQFVVGLAKDTLLLALIVTMVAAIVLGMGMPTTPAYIILTALLVPAIIKLGVIAPAAHMFAFYFAALSAITPPVALPSSRRRARQPDCGERLGRGEDRRRRLHRALHVRLRAGAADDRNVAADRRGAGVTASCGHHAVRRRAAWLFHHRGQRLAARPARRRRPPADRSWPVTDIIGAALAVLVGTVQVLGPRRRRQRPNPHPQQAPSRHPQTPRRPAQPPLARSQRSALVRPPLAAAQFGFDPTTGPASR